MSWRILCVLILSFCISTIIFILEFNLVFLVTSYLKIKLDSQIGIVVGLSQIVIAFLGYPILQAFLLFRVARLFKIFLAHQSKVITMSAFIHFVSFCISISIYREIGIAASNFTLKNIEGLITSFLITGTIYFFGMSIFFYTSKRVKNH